MSRPYAAIRSPSAAASTAPARNRWLYRGLYRFFPFFPQEWEQYNEQYNPVAGRVEGAAVARAAAGPGAPVHHQRRLSGRVATRLPVDKIAVADISHRHGHRHAWIDSTALHATT